MRTVPHQFVRSRLLFLLLLILVSVTASGSAVTPEHSDFFEKSVRPVLVKHCYECHSSSAEKVKGGLLLDSKAGWEKGGDSGPALVPGSPEKSLLITAVRHADADLKMPKQKIAEHEIAALTEWVKMGAPDPRADAAVTSRPAYDWEKERRHWAYLPLQEPALPPVQDPDWSHPIDRFVLANLRERNLNPAQGADKRTLLRRATFDLLGLPPTPEEMAAFESDNAPGAFERVVDRLLSSSHYGERWGRHWMDLVRYADTAGDNSDYPIPQGYLYRNYIIDAFNRDKPYDQFIREQIAGDLLPARDQGQKNEQVIATGYIAISRRFGSVIDRYPQHLTIEDTIDNLGKTFLGLSVSCARCHDHKFDAITQNDYYALYGIFSSTRYPFPGIELDKKPRDFVPLIPETEVEAKLGPYREQEAKLQAAQTAASERAKQLEREKRELIKRKPNAVGEEPDKIESELKDLEPKLAAAKKTQDEANKALEQHRTTRPQVPDAYAVQDAKPADARVHRKGEPDRLGEVVPRRWLELFGAQALDPSAAEKSSGRRELAEWIASRENPLTARVMANRIWHYHFGSGLVRTVSDFGVRGQAPSNRALLDHLASRFIAEGWSIKKLHRWIMLSRTYQLASRDDAQNLAVDPENRFHWRYARRRLDAESLRDTLLTLGGNLDSSALSEPHPFPSAEKWDYTQHHPFKDAYASNRRSVYLMAARLNASPFFQTFDGPDRNATTPVRDSSVTTVQALYFLNDEFLREQSNRFAARLIKEASGPEERLDRAFSLALQRLPTQEERRRVEVYLNEVQARLVQLGIPAEKHQQALWSGFARALFRTNEFLYND